MTDDEELRTAIVKAQADAYKDGYIAALALERARAEELVKALEFYFSAGDYKSPYTGGLGKLYYDCGQTAREALVKYRSGE